MNIERVNKWVYEWIIVDGFFLVVMIMGSNQVTDYS